MLKISLIVPIIVILSSCHEQKYKSKIKYHDNGYIQSIRHLNEKSVQHGPAIWFYPNGFVKQQLDFINGKVNGNAFYFYDNGAIKSHRYYKNGKLNGFITDYFNDSVGLIKAVVFFENGNLIDLRKGDSALSIENEN